MARADDLAKGAAPNRVARVPEEVQHRTSSVGLPVRLAGGGAEGRRALGAATKYTGLPTFVHTVKWKAMVDSKQFVPR